MNKRIACLLTSAFLLSGGVVYAQSVLGAYKYSQDDFNGTARYLGMGGAFGAIGGDISAMSANPAGLGIYRSSEIVTSLSVTATKAKSNWNGSMADANKTNFNFDNIGYVGYFPTGNDEGLVSWNVGFSYNRVKNFNRNYRLSGRQAYSLADYAAVTASHVGQDKDGYFGIAEDDLAQLNSSSSSDVSAAYDKLGGLWMQALGYQSGMYESFNKGGDLYHSTFGEWSADGKEWLNYSPDDVQLTVNEKGGINLYNFSLATNISNRLFIGATVAVTDLNYRMSSSYDEYFGPVGDDDHLWMDNWMKTNGTGYSFNLGVIARPVDFLRFGVAYDSPTWMRITEYYQGKAGTELVGFDEQYGETPTGVYTDSRLRTPDKWIFSAAGFIGQAAMISVDYELVNYKNMRMYDWEGTALLDNDLIKQHFEMAHTLKVGAEVKITPQLAVRAGANWRTSPMRKEFREGAYEVYPVSSLVNYTLDKGSMAYSVGLGYRFTPNFYADLACVLREYKEDAYTFSKVIIDDKVLVDSDAIGLKTKATQVSLTLGYKF